MSKPSKQERKQLIHAIGQLETAYCDPCTKLSYKSQDANKVCVDCSIFNQIRAIGDELAPAEINRDHTVKNKPRVLAKNKSVLITADEYYALKDKKMIDAEIAKLIEVNMNTLKRWKTKNNISASMRERKEAKEPMGKLESVIVSPVEENVVSELEMGNNADTVSVMNEPKQEGHSMTADQETIVELQYKKEQLERDVEMWKDRYRDFHDKFWNLSAEYTKLDADLRNSERDARMIAQENEELKETVTLNHLLMKQQVRFLDRLDSVTEKGVGEFAWR